MSTARIATDLDGNRCRCDSSMRCSRPTKRKPERTCAGTRFSSGPVAALARGICWKPRSPSRVDSIASIDCGEARMMETLEEHKVHRDIRGRYAAKPALSDQDR